MNYDAIVAIIASLPAADQLTARLVCRDWDNAMRCGMVCGNTPALIRCGHYLAALMQFQQDYATWFSSWGTANGPQYKFIDEVLAAKHAGLFRYILTKFGDSTYLYKVNHMLADPKMIKILDIWAAAGNHIPSLTCEYAISSNSPILLTSYFYNNGSSLAWDSQRYIARGLLRMIKAPADDARSSEIVDILLDKLRNMTAKEFIELLCVPHKYARRLTLPNDVMRRVGKNMPLKDLRMIIRKYHVLKMDLWPDDEIWYELAQARCRELS